LSLSRHRQPQTALKMARRLNVAFAEEKAERRFVVCYGRDHFLVPIAMDVTTFWY